MNAYSTIAISSSIILLGACILVSTGLLAVRDAGPIAVFVGFLLSVVSLSSWFYSITILVQDYREDDVAKPKQDN